MGIFSKKNLGMGGHKQSGGGQYFKTGTHICKVVGLKHINGRSGEAIITEFVVIETDNEEWKPGARPTYYQPFSGSKFDQYKETFLGNIEGCHRAVLACKYAMMGEPVKPADVEYNNAVADDMIEESDPYELIGTIVGTNVFDIKTKAGNEITKNEWFVPDNIADYVEDAA